MGYKFRNKHMTKLINETLDLRLQLFMWGRIESLLKEGLELDYLQIFKLERLKTDTQTADKAQAIIKVTHSQEQPEEAAFEQIYHLKIEDPGEDFETCKIYVIDDGKYSTMLFASEY